LHIESIERKAYDRTQYRWNWFSFPPAIIVYKVTANTELAKTESLLLREYRVRFLQVSGHIFYQPINIELHFVCVSI
jgi:hypothetical protein